MPEQGHRPQRRRRRDKSRPAETLQEARPEPDAGDSHGRAGGQPRDERQQLVTIPRQIRHPDLYEGTDRGQRDDGREQNPVEPLHRRPPFLLPCRFTVAAFFFASTTAFFTTGLGGGGGGGGS